MRRATSLSATSWFGGATSRRARLKWSGRWSSIRVRPTSWGFPPGSRRHLGFRPEQGAAQCDKAYRLNSAPPTWYPAFCYKNYFLPNATESAEATKRYDAWYRARVLDSLVFGAAAQVEAGAADDAAATIAEWKQKYPQALPVEAYMSDYTVYSRQQEADQLVASLRKAGAPMCVPGEKRPDFPRSSSRYLKICDE